MIIKNLTKGEAAARTPVFDRRTTSWLRAVARDQWNIHIHGSLHVPMAKNPKWGEDPADGNGHPWMEARAYIKKLRIDRDGSGVTGSTSTCRDSWMGIFYGSRGTEPYDLHTY